MLATYDPSQNRRMKLDFPTPLSPMRMILKMWSYVTCELLPSAVAMTVWEGEGEGGGKQERDIIEGKKGEEKKEGQSVGEGGREENRK